MERINRIGPGGRIGPPGYAMPAQVATPVSEPVTDESLLRAAKIGNDDTGLVEFLQTRAQGATSEQIAAQVKLLSSANAGERARAFARLVAIGPPALSALRLIASDMDSLVSAQARRCLQVLEQDSSQLTAAVIRQTVQRRPAQALSALLQLLPQAENETVVDELRQAIATLAHSGRGGGQGQLDPGLPSAVADPVALRRAVVADVLCQIDTPDCRRLLRGLLLDPIAAVRFHAALGLARVNDAKAVSTLIALLPDISLPLARQAEDFLQNLAGEQAPKTTLGEDAAERVRCRDAWALWWLATEDGQSAMEEFRKRTRADSDREHVKTLINSLGDDDFSARQKATDALKALGGSIAPLLRQASSHPDPEIRQRAAAVLQEIEKVALTPLATVWPRLLALRKPAGAMTLLLAFLPSAEDEALLAEVQGAINSIALDGATPDAALLAALTDSIPARRASAAEALAQLPQYRAEVRKRLTDSDTGVRLKTALALAGVGDRDAVPVLVALTAESAGEIASHAEDYLRRLAGGMDPKTVASVPAGDGEARSKRRAAWMAWWSAEGSKRPLLDRPAAAYLATRHLGYTLMVMSQNGIIAEFDSSGKQRWQIAGLAQPQDAQVLPGERVLIMEVGGKVTERNFKGDVLWQKSYTGSWPVSARRLNNGHTFIATRNRISEIDHAGNEVYAFDRPSNDVMTASRGRDGRITVISSMGQILVFDTTGRELKSTRVAAVANFGNEILPNGGALVPVSWQNRVTEYDADGKVVWDTNVTQPMAACRLPNGNTLVSCQQWPARITELDRAGKTVNEITAPGYVQRISRR